MNRLASSLIALVLAGGLGGGLAACGGSAPPAAAPGADVAAPYPYTVLQIRAGCPFGRVIEYRVDKAGAPPAGERWTFQPLDDGETVKITTDHFDDTGKATGAPEVETDKWTELHEHGRFPASATTIDDEVVELPAGKFDAMHYVVRQGDVVKSFWFARNLPGPPVKMIIAKGGAPVFTMTMQGNRTH